MRVPISFELAVHALPVSVPRGPLTGIGMSPDVTSFIVGALGLSTELTNLLLQTVVLIAKFLIGGALV